MQFEYEGRKVHFKGLCPRELLSIEVGRSMLSNLDMGRGLFLHLNEVKGYATTPQVPTPTQKILKQFAKVFEQP